MLAAHGFLLEHCALFEHCEALFEHCERRSGTSRRIVDTGIVRKERLSDRQRVSRAPRVAPLPILEAGAFSAESLSTLFSSAGRCGAESGRGRRVRGSSSAGERVRRAIRRRIVRRRVQDRPCCRRRTSPRAGAVSVESDCVSVRSSAWTGRAGSRGGQSGSTRCDPVEPRWSTVRIAPGAAASRCRSLGGGAAAELDRGVTRAFRFRAREARGEDRTAAACRGHVSPRMERRFDAERRRAAAPPVGRAPRGSVPGRRERSRSSAAFSPRSRADRACCAACRGGGELLRSQR